MQYEDAALRLTHARHLLRCYPRQWVDGKKCLDIGCGGGNLLLAMAELGGREILGIDVNLSEFGENHFQPLALAEGIDASRVTFLEGRTEDQRFPDDHFDFITLFDVIEHVSNPAETLAEIYRILKPGGIFILDVGPLYYSQVGSHLWPFYPRETAPWAHLYYDFDAENACGRIDAWHWKHYLGLNKLNRTELHRYMAAAGFITRDFEEGGIHVRGSWAATAGEEDFAFYQGRIDVSRVPYKEDLFVEWARLIPTKL
jgi:ubiquinone/menaquinone biosynthesis C-methylase UbiE